MTYREGRPRTRALPMPRPPSHAPSAGRRLRLAALLLALF